MAAALHFDAVITPNRSLSPRGFRILIGVMLAINLATGAVFLSIGALPVPLFLGLELLGVFLAFKVNYRGGGVSERVQVSADSVTVLRHTPHGRQPGQQVVWRSATAFTKVEVSQDQDDVHLGLAISGRRRPIGQALSPQERLDLGRALERAIVSARSER